MSKFETVRDAVAHARELDVIHGVTPQIDREFLEMAHLSVAADPSSFFKVVDEEYVHRTPRPDAINHHLSYLPPNLKSTAEQEKILGLLNILHGAEADMLAAQFADFTDEHDLFGKVDSGMGFIAVGNHFELADLGFDLGYLHRAAKQKGYDRFENYVSLVIGRLLGYFQLGDDNVIDDILRKACGVIKSFPVAGGEALATGQFSESDLDKAMRAVMKYSNSESRRGITTKVASHIGHIVMLAGGGAKEFANEFGVVDLNNFSQGTEETLIEACQEYDAEVIPMFRDYALRPDGHSLVKFGAPRKLLSHGDVVDMGKEIAHMGNEARAEARKTHPNVARFNDKIEYHDKKVT